MKHRVRRRRPGGPQRGMHRCRTSQGGRVARAGDVCRSVGTRVRARLLPPECPVRAGSAAARPPASADWLPGRLALVLPRVGRVAGLVGLRWPGVHLFVRCHRVRVWRADRRPPGRWRRIWLVGSRCPRATPPPPPGRRSRVRVRQATRALRPARSRCGGNATPRRAAGRHRAVARSERPAGSGCPASTPAGGALPVDLYRDVGQLGQHPRPDLGAVSLAYPRLPRPCNEYVSL